MSIYLTNLGHVCKTALRSLRAGSFELDNIHILHLGTYLKWLCDLYTKIGHVICWHDGKKYSKKPKTLFFCVMLIRLFSTHSRFYGPKSNLKFMLQ